MIKLNRMVFYSTIAFDGILCEVDKYLPEREHAKDVCKLNYERCRRCRNNRNYRDHKLCSVLYRHCRRNHQVNDYA